MRKLYVLAGLLYALNAYSQDYYISFSGAGESFLVSTVSVENLTAGTSLVMNGSDILHLTNIVTGNHTIDYGLASGLKIYPNPVINHSTIEVCPPEAGNAVISILDMTGRPVARIQSYLENTGQSFRLSGMKNGFYLINIKGNNYQYSGKLLCNGGSQGTIRIEKGNSIIQIVEEKPQNTGKKGTLATVDMAYTPGDRLLFIGKSGIYSTVKTDIPASDKTIAFNFYECTDGDNNNYPVVEIGTEVWMAENLKTTRYNDGSPIPYVTDAADWTANDSPAYCWYDNDAITNKDTYGALYKYYAISPRTNESRYACPAGWHIPGYEDWQALFRYGIGVPFASSLKETGTAHWLSPNADATNETGFTALPAGARKSEGNFSGIGRSSTWWDSQFPDTHGGFEPPRSGRIWGFSYNGSVGASAETSMVEGISVRCIKGVQTLPTVTTSSVTSVTMSTATCGGFVSNEGGVPLISRGVCWSTTPNPTMYDKTSRSGTGTGAFTCTMTKLTQGTVYYVRAFALNSVGPEYGNQVSFSTQIADVDGNIYNTVTIGTQVWMAENLKTTKFNDNTDIPSITDNAAWSTLLSPGYCWFNNDQTSYKATYGALYNWYTANTGLLCPTGWYVPSDADWTELLNSLGDENFAGGKLKEAGITHWQSPNSGATNESGFTALPGGNRKEDGTFYDVGNFGYWWSSTKYYYPIAFLRYLYYNSSTFNKVSYDKKNGFSVRCLKNDYLDINTVITSITSTSANSGGNITSEDGSMVTARGVCWGTSHNPTIADSKTIDGSGTGPFSSNISGLSANTTYYVRAYATNSTGTGYGNELILKTYTGTVTDIEGNVYNTVTIGTQVWMAENLKTTKYTDNTAIPLITDDTEWRSLITPAYCWYNNDESSYKATYGALYNWYVLDALSNGGKNACPVGWKAPGFTDWNILITYLGGNLVAGGKLKETGNTHWTGQNLGATNESGFTALPGGNRGFSFLGTEGYFWSSEYSTSTAWCESLENAMITVDNHNGRLAKLLGFSVRCIKDN
jgi:uncharacterized protein (TIGR02145 family)